MQSRRETAHRAGRAGALLVAGLLAAGCAPPQPEVRTVALELARLVSVDQNDADGAPDEVRLRVRWTSEAAERRELPGAGRAWRLASGDEVGPEPIGTVVVAAGVPVSVEVELTEDDQRAERVSNQVDDTLARFTLVLSVAEGGTLSVEAVPRPGDDNNAIGPTPTVELALDEAVRAVTFVSAYRNDAGPVRYEGRVTW